MNYKPETNQEILDLAKGINIAGADKKNAKFSMIIATDKHALKKHVTFIEAAKEVPEEYEELGKAVAEVRAKYATAIEGGQTKVPDDKWPEFKAELDELREDPKNKKIEDDYEAQLKSYKKLLKSKPKDEDGKPLVIKMVEIPKSMNFSSPSTTAFFSGRI